MCPSFATDNEANVRRCNAILARKGGMRDSASGVALADGAHLPFSEFGLAMAFAAKDAFRMFPGVMLVAARSPLWMGVGTMHFAGGLSSFSNLVAPVLLRGCGEQMARIAAGRVVASVTDPKSLGNRAICECPGNAVRVEPAITHSAKTKLSVTERSFTRLPGPAIVRPRDADLFPEAKNVLRSHRRDATRGSSHDGLRCRLLWSGRFAVSAAGRPLFMGEHTGKGEACQAKSENRKAA